MAARYAKNSRRPQADREQSAVLRMSWSGTPTPAQFGTPSPAAYRGNGAPFAPGQPQMVPAGARLVNGAQMFKPTVAPGYGQPVGQQPVLAAATFSGGPPVQQQRGGMYFQPQPQASQVPLQLNQPQLGPGGPLATGLNSHIPFMNPSQGLQVNIQHQRTISSPIPGAQILPSNPRLELQASASLALSPRNGSAVAAPATSAAAVGEQSPVASALGPVVSLRAKYLGWNVVECLYGAECTLPIIYKMLPQHRVSEREFEQIPDASFDFFEKGFLVTNYTKTRNPRFGAMPMRPVGAPVPQEPEFLVQKNIEPFVDEDRVLFSVRPEPPHDRVVGVIQLGLRQDSKRKVHLFLYLCDTPEVAAVLFDQFRRLSDGPEKLVNIRNLEGQLISEGQISTHSKELLRAVAAPYEPLDNRQRSKKDEMRGELANLFRSGGIAGIVLPPRDYPQPETIEDEARKRLADNQSEPISPGDSGNGDRLRVRLRPALPPVAPKPQKVSAANPTNTQGPNSMQTSELPPAAASDSVYSSPRKLSASAGEQQLNGKTPQINMLTVPNQYSDPQT